MMKKQRLVVLSGAGMSAESGISTFRDSDGLWEQYSVEQVATPEGYQKDKALVLEFYNQRRKQLLEVQPNEGHRLVAALEQHYDVAVVTQNVDNLHERAGSSHVVHLHGELKKVCSERDPQDERYIRTLKPEEYSIRPGDVGADGAQLRPYIVWFGEPVPKITDAMQLVSRADILVVIGTSLQVYPAAGLVGCAPQGCRIFLIDPKEVQVPYNVDVEIIKEGASRGMQQLMQRLGL